MTAVQQATGRYPGLYGGSYLKELLARQCRSDPRPVLVLARRIRPVPHVPEGWPTWTLWQYTDGAFGPEPHTVAGVGRCDRDLFNGDISQLQRLWGSAGLVNHAVAAPAACRFCSITSHTMRAARSLGRHRLLP